MSVVRMKAKEGSESDLVKILVSQKIFQGEFCVASFK